MDRSDCVLVVVDVQEKLAATMPDRDELVRRLLVLIRGARILGIPVWLTEQIPEKLGATLAEIREAAGAAPIGKSTFSCMGCGEFRERVEAAFRRTFLVCGIEAHVCVYQTARDLLQAGLEVEVVADAVASRDPANRGLALDRLARIGVGIASTEMLLFDLLGKAGTEEFRAILRLVK